MPITDQDARALTYLACRIRKETHGCREWDEAGTYAVVSQLIGQSLTIAVERVTRHAADPEAKTPGAIKRPFIPAAKEPGPRFPAKVGEDCRHHKGEWADTCRVCAVDGIPHPEDPVLDGDTSAGQALLASIRERNTPTEETK